MFTIWQKKFGREIFEIFTLKNVIFWPRFTNFKQYVVNSVFKTSTAVFSYRRRIDASMKIIDGVKFWPKNRVDDDVIRRRTSLICVWNMYVHPCVQLTLCTYQKKSISARNHNFLASFFVISQKICDWSSF